MTDAELILALDNRWDGGDYSRLYHLAAERFQELVDDNALLAVRNNALAAVLERVVSVKVDPTGCCGDASWRGRLCQYHQGFADALDVVSNW